MAFGMIVWAALSGLYLLFAGQASGQEIGAGLGFAFLAAALITLLHTIAAYRLRLRAPGRLARWDFAGDTTLRDTTLQDAGSGAAATPGRSAAPSTIAATMSDDAAIRWLHNLATSRPAEDRNSPV